MGKIQRTIQYDEQLSKVLKFCEELSLNLKLMHAD